MGHHIRVVGADDIVRQAVILSLDDPDPGQVQARYYNGASEITAEPQTYTGHGGWRWAEV